MGEEAKALKAETVNTNTVNTNTAFDAHIESIDVLAQEMAKVINSLEEKVTIYSGVRFEPSPKEDLSNFESKLNRNSFNIERLRYSFERLQHINAVLFDFL